MILCNICRGERALPKYLIKCRSILFKISIQIRICRYEIMLALSAKFQKTPNKKKTCDV